MLRGNIRAEEIFARKRPSLPPEPIHIWLHDTFQRTPVSSTGSWNCINSPALLQQLLLMMWDISHTVSLISLSLVFSNIMETQVYIGNTFNQVIFVVHQNPYFQVTHFIFSLQKATKLSIPCNYEIRSVYFLMTHSRS